MFKKSREKSGLEKAIDEVLSDMNGFTSDQDEYAKMVNHLEKLHEMKTAESPKPVSLDTLILATGNLLGILVIVSYEQKNVITSKALSLLQKLR